MATSPQKIAGGGAVAVIVALIGSIQYFHVDVTAFFTDHQNVIAARAKDFGTAIDTLEKSLYVAKPDTTALRGLAFEAYRRASDLPVQPMWKCQVVDLIWNASNPNVAQTTPLTAYEDFRRAALPCDDHILTLAQFDWDTFHALHGTDALSNERLAMSQRVLAMGTAPKTQGWIYIGRRERGRYLVKYVDQATVAVGGVVTVAFGGGLPLQANGPGASNSDDSGVVGFLPAGSSYKILALKAVEERLQGAPSAHYVWANAEVSAVMPLASRATARGARRELADRVRMQRRLNARFRAATCPAYSQHNSLHAPTQRWLLVGEKRDSDETTFEANTSLLDTPCIPRDGSIVHPLHDLKVFVGADPHWPGVMATRDFVATGTSIQIVGDISGYPFDATAQPDFCRHAPKPQKTLDPIPAGHEKRYCVYVPFNPT